ncbi:hypothetical protein PV327_006784 [Microctonus hyperodae]|uniref:C2H2-type domain-containing protein n=1 Tax=Microctonus hyperodae TaxID=165561 RepID=A0AA39KIP7_MICHY|nr:hypothetical protein PV327_006784 [Microctonus hyperodae]
MGVNILEMEKLIYPKITSHEERTLTGVYPCPQCGRTYVHRYTLNRHLNYECGKYPQFICQGRAHTCDSCGRTYKWKESLRQHQRLECGIQPQFGCHLCGRRFHANILIELQIINFYLIPELVATAVFPCRRCGRIFLNKKTMWNHLAICGKEPQYPCESCGKRFRQKHHLTKHLKSSVHRTGNLINATECKDNKNWFYE